VLHVATVHWHNEQWIDVQLRYLRRHITEPMRVWACLEGVGPEHDAKFDVVVPAVGPHAGKLNLLATDILAVADDDDLVMFLDGDAFPIADPMPTVRALLDDHALVAIRRTENARDPQPHPSFCVTRVGTWRDLPGDWSLGYPWMGPAGKLVSDPGGNLLHLLELRGLPWAPLERTNTFDLHPLWFGVYGDVVYHHGAGFRPAFSRHDVEGKPPLPPRSVARIPVVGQVATAAARVRRYVWFRRLRRRADALSAGVFADLDRDPAFHHRFCPHLAAASTAASPAVSPRVSVSERAS
jgi:hypothetical protein